MPPVAEHGPPPDAMAVDQAVNRLGSGVRNMSVVENGAYGRPPVPPGTQAHLQAQQQAQLSQQQQQQQQQLQQQQQQPTTAWTVHCNGAGSAADGRPSSAGLRISRARPPRKLGTNPHCVERQQLLSNQCVAFRECRGSLSVTMVKRMLSLSLQVPGMPPHPTAYPGLPQGTHVPAYGDPRRDPLLRFGH